MLNSKFPFTGEMARAFRQLSGLTIKDVCGFTGLEFEDVFRIEADDYRPKEKQDILFDFYVNNHYNKLC
jgi:transcriptional regulator with XRE-family HTH domain